MKTKATLKMMVDLAMTALFLGQMGYHMMDNRMHEWTGVTLLVLFILHHALNIGWHRSLARGRYTPERILLTVTNVLLTAAMLTVAVSAILVSRHVFDFLGLRMRALGRRIHMPATMWFFVFMSLHLGLHLPAMIATLRRRHPWMQTTIAKGIMRAASLLLLLYGIYEFISRELYMELLMLREFAFLDYGESLETFFIAYTAMAAAGALVSCTLLQALKRLNAKRKETT